jgi:hypothetical protein
MSYFYQTAFVLGTCPTFHVNGIPFSPLQVSKTTLKRGGLR